MTEQRPDYLLTVAPRKNLPLMAGLTLALLLWGAGLIAVIAALFQGGLPGVSFFVIFFLLAWLGGWLLAGGVLLYALLWMSSGNETITLQDGQLTINRKLYGYQKSQQYDVTKIRKVRLTEEESGWAAFLFSLRPFGLDNGRLSFDYGVKLISFAAGLKKNEAPQTLIELTDALTRSRVANDE